MSKDNSIGNPPDKSRPESPGQDSGSRAGCDPGQEHGHDHGHSHGHDHGRHVHDPDDSDYLKAVAEYRATFPDKARVLAETPDPAVREMLAFMEEQGLETVFDRFDRQKPHCSYGVAGSCCRICTVGPCRINAKNPRGACGADADLIAARGLLRMIAAGTAAHGARGREVMLALKAAAEKRLPFPLAGEKKIRLSAKALGLETENRPLEDIAGELAETLLEDLSRTVPGPHRTLAAMAPPERIETWRKLDILPISAYHEVFEAYHRTNFGTDGDWRNVMQQFHRTGLGYTFSSVVGSSIAMDSLLGLPERRRIRCNLGALSKDQVNIAVHGHSPVLVSEIVRQGRSPEMAEAARKAGAGGIAFYGICCSGLSAMYRYGGVIPLANAVGAELVLGTGALDLWAADVQDVMPSIMDTARCFKTTVVTTSDSGRLPGSEFYGYDHDHSNFEDTQNLARTIVRRAVESFEDRREVPRRIPAFETEAETGFSVENITAQYAPQGLGAIAEAMKKGLVAGAVNLVGCSNPRVVYEKAVYEIAKYLIEHNVLVLTNGCASFPLMKMGLCSRQAEAGEGLRQFLGPDLPPVWHMGECLDNARASILFRLLADAAGRPLKDMPLAFSSPEWGNEKGVAAAAAFRLMGLNSYHCVRAPIMASPALQNYLTRETAETLGSKMITDPDPLRLAEIITADLEERRRNLLD
ncbi:MAG: anaerobic carbon-monoxide dehydrogenase catalytic subunit [Deltaproteobacteria bacterium]|jgi:carbon-monoxide dehydrogenase catalytic subunit|nr:anaerobic carbon-monoxide dehydrogenase catalytic subunit [Deltaproteobacteria bacterium]